MRYSKSNTITFVITISLLFLKLNRKTPAEKVMKYNNCNSTTTQKRGFFDLGVGSCLLYVLGIAKPESDPQTAPSQFVLNRENVY